MRKALSCVNYHRDQIELLLRVKFGAIAVNFVGPIFYYFLFKEYIPSVILFSWIGTQFMIFAARMYIANQLTHLIEQHADLITLNETLKSYLWTVFGNALLWGLSIIPAIEYAEIQYIFVLIGAVLFMLTGAMSTLVPVYHAIIIFNVTIAGIFPVVLTFMGAEYVYYMTSILFVIYLIVGVPASFRIYSSIRDNILQKEQINALNNELNQNVNFLQNTNKNFQNLLDGTMEAIIISDIYENIVDINQSGVKLFGFNDKRSTIGHKITELIPESSLITFRAHFQSQKDSNQELEMQTMNGTHFPALAHSADMHIDGDIMKITTVMDLTKIKEKDKLLIQQSRQAAMGEMIGNIAHQWRQPLNALGLVVQNIYFEHQMGTLDDKTVEESVEKAQKLTRNMSQTIDDFRNFFSPNKQKEYFDISSAIRSAITLVEASFESMDITLTKEIEQKVEVYGYANEFSQVVMNLLSNAKDAIIDTNCDKREIFIKAYNGDAYVVIEVQDYAGGIPEEIIDKVCDPYFTTKEEGKGTGIGLYMTKMIVEKNMNGKLSVKNYQGGALFSVIFPVQKNPEKTIYNHSESKVKVEL